MHPMFMRISINNKYTNRVTYSDIKYYLVKLKKKFFMSVPTCNW